MISDLDERFNVLANTLAHLMENFKFEYTRLNKNSMERVSMAFIEYPVPAEKAPASPDEDELTKLAFKIKETQMAMATIHAISQGEENE